MEAGKTTLLVRTKKGRRQVFLVDVVDPSNPSDSSEELRGGPRP